jgi:hypothetical protein
VAIAELKADSPRGVFVQKQRANVYTMMLILSLMFIMVGCLCMFLEMNAFGMMVRVPDGRNGSLDLRASSVKDPEPPAPVAPPGM